jgi:hydroxymethylglutaryl-CoA reductase
MTKLSLISGFYKLTPKERLDLVKEFADLSDEECALLQNTGSLPLDMADRMIENVVGAFPLPLGIGVNFLINGKDYLIPMAIEEPSVVAAASYAAKMVREGGGFRTSSTAPVMIGQVQVVDLADPKRRFSRRRTSRTRFWLRWAAAQKTSTPKLSKPPKDQCSSWSCTWTAATPWEPTPSTPWQKPSPRS